jgi:hypothetical protein
MLTDSGQRQRTAGVVGGHNIVTMNVVVELFIMRDAAGVVGGGGWWGR